MRQPCGSLRVDADRRRRAARRSNARSRDRDPRRRRGDERAGVGAVEALEHTRRLGSGMPGPSSSDFEPRAARRRRSRARAPCRRGGECRTAFSTRFATTWCNRSASASSSKSRGSTSISKSTSVACSCDSRIACSSIGPISNDARSSGSVPDSRRERSSSCCTSRPSRSTCASIVRKRLGIGVGDAVDEVLEHGLQRGDRRAQLVTDVGDEVAAQPVGLGELGRHLVERTGERADLVVRRRRDALREVAARHRFGRGDHLAQRRA